MTHTSECSDCRCDYPLVDASLRFGYVQNAGFDRFAKTDVLPGLALEWTTTVVEAGSYTAAAGVAWDASGRSDGFRGAESSLGVNRFTIPLEGRFRVSSRAYVYGRVAPGLALLTAKIDDRVAPALSTTQVAFAGDLAVGGAFRLNREAEGARLGLWVRPEIGYAFASTAGAGASGRAAAAAAAAASAAIASRRVIAGV
jgi:hypothetical protein